MSCFIYKESELYIEDMKVVDIAKEVSTPFYCYSQKTIIDNYHNYHSAFKKLTPLICYAVKANPNLSILSLLNSMGAGADCVSSGEIFRALKSGIPANRIVFSGVGKTHEELKFALDNDILQFNVESIPELELLETIANRLGKKARVALRVNPDIDCESNDKISTGKKENKFGIANDQLLDACKRANGMMSIKLQGISVHIGSQILSLKPYAQLFASVKKMICTLRENGIDIATIDLGGGIGVKYDMNTNVINLQEYADLIEEEFSGFSGQIILEPGRAIIADAGILVSQVLYIKSQQAEGSRKFAVVDAGMNDFMRPALYGSYHNILSIKQGFVAREEYDIVGPVCESSDIFYRGAKLPSLKNGDLLAIEKVGAYGASMSSTYNSRALISEILVEGNKFKTIRRRQTKEAMLADEYA